MLCIPDPIEKLYLESDVVFEAVVVKRTRTKEINPKWKKICWRYSERQPTCGPKIALLKLIKSYKGKVKRLSTIYSEDACYCLGSYLSEGEAYIIFGKSADHKKTYELIATPGCLGIQPMEFLPKKDIYKIYELSK